MRKASRFCFQRHEPSEAGVHERLERRTPGEDLQIKAVSGGAADQRVFRVSGVGTKGSAETRRCGGSHVVPPQIMDASIGPGCELGKS